MKVGASPPSPPPAPTSKEPPSAPVAHLFELTLANLNWKYNLLSPYHITLNVLHKTKIYVLRQNLFILWCYVVQKHIYEQTSTGQEAGIKIFLEGGGAIFTKLNPWRTGGWNASKNIGRQARNPACLPTCLEAFLPPLRVGLSLKSDVSELNLNSSLKFEISDFSLF